jgi:hypothetical protein
MQTDPGLQTKPKLFWLLLAGAAVAVLALGWWFFRARKTPVAADQQTSQSQQTVSPSLPVSVSSTVTNTPAAVDPNQTPGYGDLLDGLRKKLSGSVADALAALAEIALTQPDLAARLAQDLGRTDEEKAAWVKDIVKKWAERDPQHAWNWLTQQTFLSEKVANASLVSEVMGVMAASDPEMLIGNMDKLLRQGNTTGLFGVQNATYLGLQALIKSGNVNLAQEAVEVWANDPLKLPVGAAGYEIVAMAMDKNNPESTGAWLTSMPASDDRNSAIDTFAYMWGESNPAAAMRWAQSLTTQEGQSEIAGRVFSEWIQSDPDAATNWLDNYISNTPNNTGNDTMIGSMVLFSPAVKNDPGEALKLVDTISNPQTRAAYQQQIFQSWGRTDPAAATDYVTKSPTIDSSLKTLLLQQIKDASNPNPPEQ